MCQGGGYLIAPVLLVLAEANELHEGRMAPQPRRRNESMLNRIPVDVIEVPLPIGFVPNAVLPTAALPNAPLAAPRSRYAPRWFLVSGFQQGVGKPGFDQSPP